MSKKHGAIQDPRRPAWHMNLNMSAQDDPTVMVMKANGERTSLPFVSYAIYRPKSVAGQMQKWGALA